MSFYSGGPKKSRSEVKFSSTKYKVADPENKIYLSLIHNSSLIHDLLPQACCACNSTFLCVFYSWGVCLKCTGVIGSVMGVTETKIKVSNLLCIQNRDCIFLMQDIALLALRSLNLEEVEIKESHTNVRGIEA